jgi:hypothetical protein
MVKSENLKVVVGHVNRTEDVTRRYATSPCSLNSRLNSQQSAVNNNTFRVLEDDGRRYRSN